MMEGRPKKRDVEKEEEEGEGEEGDGEEKGVVCKLRSCINIKILDEGHLSL